MLLASIYTFDPITVQILVLNKQQALTVIVRSSYNAASCPWEGLNVCPTFHQRSQIHETLPAMWYLPTSP